MRQEAGGIGSRVVGGERSEGRYTGGGRRRGIKFRKQAAVRQRHATRQRRRLRRRPVVVSDMSGIAYKECHAAARNATAPPTHKAVRSNSDSNALPKPTVRCYRRNNPRPAYVINRSGAAAQRCPPRRGMPSDMSSAATSAPQARRQPCRPPAMLPFNRPR